MAEKRRGLGRGLGALIPSAPTGDRPVDVFFPGAGRDGAGVSEPWHAPGSASTDPELQPEPESPQRADAPDSPDAPDVVHGDPLAPALPDPSDDPDDPDDDGTEAGGRHGLEGDSEPGSSGAGWDDATDGGTRGHAPPAGTDGSTTASHTAGHDEATGGTGTTATTDGVPDGLVPTPGVRYAEISVETIRPNPRQPRTVFDQDELAELVSSIREVGVLQPIVVRPLGSVQSDHPQFELIMGERRWRATQAAGLSTVPAIIRETDDADLLRDALLENLHRSQLNPLEEAAAYQQLLDDFGCTHDELSQRIHRSRPQISNTLRLLKLPPLVQRRVAAGVLSAGHARALLGLPDAASMERLAQRIVAESLSVRATEEIVALGGDTAREPVRRPRAGAHNVALDDLASRLSDRLDTRVKIALGRSKGRLTVEFASVEDLNRILSTLTPDDPGLLR